METDERIPIGLGTAAWVVALIVLLALGDRLPPEQRWWIWTCVAGACGGVFGLWFVPRLRRRQRDGGH